MLLAKFDLVNTKGLRGLDYQGRFIPFEKIDDTLAEELEGKTHVLKRKSPKATAAALSAATAEAGK